MKYLAKYLFIGALALSGCDSGFLDAGIEGTGEQVTVASSYGTVSGFGSIYVNGVHFDTDSAAVEIAGVPATEQALAVGMVVEVIGRIDADGKTGAAQRIRAEQVLLGVIDAVNEVSDGRKAISVLGQRVYINEDATFENVTFADLAPGLGVSISGFVADSGSITATYLARKEIDVTTDNVEVEGYIGAVNDAARTFQLKDLVVQTGGAVFVDGVAADIKAGARVHVAGILLAEMSLLQAERVTFTSRPAREDRYTIIEGVVHDLNAGASFTVQTTLVDLLQARIENGSLQDLQNGAQVIVFGPLVQGVLKADRIHIKPRNPSRFRGEVSEIDAVEGTFQLLDNLFKVTKFTQFKDNSRMMERYFNLERLRIGEEVEVFAVSVDGVWQVTRITRRDQNIGPEGPGPDEHPEGPLGGFPEGPPDRLRGKPTLVDDSRRFFIGNLSIDASEVPEHEWNALRDNQPEDVAVEGFYLGGGQFRALHIHIHIPPAVPCNPYDCGDGKPAVLPPAKHRQ